MNSKPLLVLVTSNYPFEFNHGEIPFVRPEIKQLSRVFEHIIVVPLHPYGRNLDPSVNFKLDLSLALELTKGRLRRLLENISSDLLWQSFPELLRALTKAGYKGVIRTLQWIVLASVTERWATKRFSGHTNVLFYTYWRMGVTLGLSTAAQEHQKWKVVTRVHGSDLYSERHLPPFQPFSPQIYKELDQTYAISKFGVDYLNHLGVSSDHITLAHLGVEDPGFVCNPSCNDGIHLISCSFMVPVKRVPLLAKGVSTFARKNPSIPVRWTHIGDGEEKALVIEEIQQSPANLKIELLGHLTNANVWNFYQNNCCDLFLHVSASEGLPVAMQEACAVGLPIISSNVGGVSEIVTDKNGRLLPANPSVNDITNMIEWFFFLKGSEKELLRRGAREIWAQFFDARTNHFRFAQNLLQISRRL